MLASRNRWFVFLLVSLLGFLATGSTVGDPPGRTSSFFGTITVAGQDVAAGTPIAAFVAGVELEATTVFDSPEGSAFRIDLPADDPATATSEGGVDGDTVTVNATSYAGRPTLFYFALRLRNGGGWTPIRDYVWLSSWQNADADGRVSHSFLLNSTGSIPYEISSWAVCDDPMAARVGRYLISLPTRFDVN